MRQENVKKIQKNAYIEKNTTENKTKSVENIKKKKIGSEWKI